MTNATEPGEGGAALAEIIRPLDQIIEGTLVPSWYWWAVAVPMIGLGVVVDTHVPLAIASVAVIFGVGVALLTGWIIVGGRRQVKVHDTPLRPRDAGLIVGFVWLFVGGTIGFVWLLVGGTIGLAFALQVASVRYAGTIATFACAVALVLAGPALMRRLRDVMRRRWAEVDR